MLQQAKDLVARMRASTIDFDNSWKLVTFFVGGNDLCRTCENVSHIFGEKKSTLPPSSFHFECLFYFSSRTSPPRTI